MAAAPVSLDELPIDVLLNISTYLSTQCILLALAPTCKLLYAVAHSDTLWYHLHFAPQTLGEWKAVVSKHKNLRSVNLGKIAATDLHDCVSDLSPDLVEEWWRGGIEPLLELLTAPAEQLDGDEHTTTAATTTTTTTGTTDTDTDDNNAAAVGEEANTAATTDTEPHLRKLYDYHLCFTEDTLSVLAAMVGSSLTSLSFNEYLDTPESLVVLSASLPCLKCLEMMNTDWIDVAPTAFPLLEKVMLTVSQWGSWMDFVASHPRLENLFIGCYGELLGNVLPEDDSLVPTSLTRLDYHPGTGTLLEAFLANNHRLEHLSAPHNVEITSAMWDHLCKHGQLTSLDASLQTFYPSYLAYEFDHLKLRKFLSHSPADKGFKRIRTGFTHLTSIGGNVVTDEVLSLLGESLCHLRKLNISKDVHKLDPSVLAAHATNLVDLEIHGWRSMQVRDYETLRPACRSLTTLYVPCHTYDPVFTPMLEECAATLRILDMGGYAMGQVAVLKTLLEDSRLVKHYECIYGDAPIVTRAVLQYEEVGGRVYQYSRV